MNSWYKAKVCENCLHIGQDDANDFCVKCGSLQIYRTRACNVFKTKENNNSGWFGPKMKAIEYTEYYDKDGNYAATRKVISNFNGWYEG